MFRSLDRDQLVQITRLLLDRVARRMRAQGVELEVSDDAVQYLANAGFDPQYGARPLRRAIQRLLEDELSERLLAGEIGPASACGSTCVTAGSAWRRWPLERRRKPAPAPDEPTAPVPSGHGAAA
nr:hypothetical protein [Candidatus Solirubrobacter pratensis]